MLEKFLIEFAKSLNVIYTLGNQSPNWITKVDKRGIYIETEASRSKAQQESDQEPGSYYPMEMLIESWNIFKAKRRITANDMIHLGRRSSFLLAFYSQLPFVQVITDRTAEIGLIEFTTDQLPEASLQQTFDFLEEIIAGTYHPQALHSQITEDNIRRLKSRARQGLKLLGFIDADFNVKEEIVQYYQLSDPKADRLQTQMLESPYFKILFDSLKVINTYSKKDKLQCLTELGMLIVRNSMGDNLMKESVAEYRTRNILQWFEEVRLVDKEWNVVMEEVQYWWVNQGQTHESEKDGGFLWAPKQVKNGASLSHHIDLQKAKPGDIVFAYSNKNIKAVCKVEERAIESNKPNTITSESWQDDGILLKIKYYTLTPYISKDDIPLQWRKEEKGPFDVNGNIKQGYFYNVSDEFVQKLFSKFANDIPHELYPKFKNRDGFEDHENPPEFNPSFRSNQELIYHIHQYITSKGFYYTKEELINFYLSLKSKPFVILSGISGTGKTKIVQLFGESIGATEKNKQFTTIPVRPDWSDGSDLLGYRDIKNDFKMGPLTKVFIEASKAENRDKPYFILLDEMNLARVEYYFSDLLSVMESRKWDKDAIITDPVLRESSLEVPVTIPDNVCFIGTVNMDETTHPFSKKVLDRANTIEFNDVKFDNFDFAESSFNEILATPVSNDYFKANYLTLKDAYPGNETLIQEISSYLIQINNILKRNHSHIGYRVRDEICYYMIYSQQMELLSKEEAFDNQLLQKILPRIAGGDVRTDKVLKELFKFCTNLDLSDDQHESLRETDFQQATYPKSARKLAYMIRRFQEDGFTSFWIGS